LIKQADTENNTPNITPIPEIEVLKKYSNESSFAKK
jgi:hypothetical protein